MMAPEVRKTLKAVASAKVLCLGDLMLDRYIYGQAARLSPEAPVPVVVVKRKTCMPGGLGNVVMNLKSLGASPLAVGLVGRDRSAQLLGGLLSGALDPASPPLLEEERRPTTVKTRVIAGIQQVVRFDEESERPLPPETEERYKRAVSGLLPLCGAVAASDSGKGVLTPSFCAWLMDEADRRGVPVVVDPKGADYGRYRSAALVTPNRKELALAAGEDLAGASQERLVSAGRRLMDLHLLKNLLITRSEDGMTLLGGGGGLGHFPAKAREVFDVSGAGDTVVAAMAAALAGGLTLEDGAGLATLAAAVVVGKVGTAVASPAEIEAAGRSAG
jgi:D-beta-D-heptose 7-phosphate kinase/D-beta-D-heptose 1-phosphate adenosyltransferase